MFTTKQLKPREKKSLIVTYAIGAIGIIAIFLLALGSISLVSSGNFDVYKSLSQAQILTKIPDITPEEQQRILQAAEEKRLLEQKVQDDEDKINVLIIGRGGVRNDAPELTDSIILLSFHKRKNAISMMSIPRDLYVEYGDISRYGEPITGKINGLYVHYLAKYNDEEQAIEELQKKIGEITGEIVDHYVNIDFGGFVKLVDALGGVTIDVPKTLIDRQYPNNNHGYQTFMLKKGTWVLDGNTALKYVRSRKNTGGDFGRSERQQQVISSIKTGLLNDGYLTSPTNIKELYNIASENFSTDLGLIESVKLLVDIKLQENTVVYSSGLNTSCLKRLECDKGGYLYYPQRTHFGGQSVILVEGDDVNALDDYTNIQLYMRTVFDSPQIFDEKLKISIFSKDRDEDAAKELQKKLKLLGLEIYMAERIGEIPDNISLESTENEKEITRRLNLEEYNNQLATNNNTSSSSPINQESNNTTTKIITNGVLSDSLTLNLLKKVLGVGDKDIIKHPDGPKYARDPDTKIEILFVDNTEKKSSIGESSIKQ